MKIYNKNRDVKQSKEKDCNKRSRVTKEGIRQIY